MKPFLKTVLVLAFSIWIGSVTLMTVIVVQRQIRFETFARNHIDLLMEELSVTNMEVSIIDTYLEKVRRFFIETDDGVVFRQKLCNDKGECLDMEVSR